MIRIWTILGALSLTATALLAAPSARAASLQQVNGWATGGVPSDVTMHIYVPDNVAANPPVLVLVHYCGGTAPAVFGQAQGGGIVGAADQYGFIMVVPSSGRCWDVVSDQTRTRGGGGDSDAIMQMVTYALGNYEANAERVYATGDSSGGMMTELLLGLYPDVFKGGAAFAGMPAGCRGAGESGNGGGYSGACAGGSVMLTPEEWGDIVSAMNPGYVGHRPRVQLFHGDADDIINYQNHVEAIKEWTNVLGLSTEPTSTDLGVSLGNHQSTRQGWTNSCGFLVLDAFTSIGGDHGPSDALFPANYVIPFLGLDKMGPIDPEIEQCGDGGGDGEGGDGTGGLGAGGASGVAGSGEPMGGGAGGMGGFGTSGVGGSVGVGGSGVTGVGGALTADENTGMAGSVSAGGSLGTDGGSATGGSVNPGGAPDSGDGTSSADNTVNSNSSPGGGASASPVVAGGSVNAVADNTTDSVPAVTGGPSGNPMGGGSSSASSGCVLSNSRSTGSGGFALVALGLALAIFNRRRAAGHRWPFSPADVARQGSPGTFTVSSRS